MMTSPLAGYPAGVAVSAPDAELAELVQSRPPQDPVRQAACEILVRRHEGIVRSCAYRYRDSPEPIEDLLQVGYVGLMKAINGFDPAVGASLAGYAQPTVSGEIKRHFRDKRWQLRVRRQIQDLRLELRAAVPDLAQQLGRQPGTAELAAHLGVPEADVAEARLAERAMYVDSLDAPAAPDDLGSGSVGSLVGAEDPAFEHVADMDAVWQYSQELPERQQRLLMMRFYGNMTQEQMARELGISQMHVSRLLSAALARLRERLARDQAGETAAGQLPEKRP
jgi:RNA polymerase sigma-B factor